MSPPGPRPPRRSAAWAALGLLALTLCCGPGATAPEHLLLVVVDTLRADRLGFYGHERNTPPELERWVGQGAVFERALATSPWTLPSFATLLTGRLPARHGAARWPKSFAGPASPRLPS